MVWIKQVGLGRAQGIAVPTFKPDRAEMGRIQATIRECSNCRKVQAGPSVVPQNTMLRARCRGGSSGSPAGRPSVSPGGTDAQLSPRISLAGATTTESGGDQEACPSPGPPPGTHDDTPLDLIDSTATAGSAPSPRSRDCRALPSEVGRARCGGERLAAEARPASLLPTERLHDPTGLTFSLCKLQTRSLQSRVHGVYGNGGAPARGGAPGALLPPLNLFTPRREGYDLQCDRLRPWPRRPVKLRQPAGPNDDVGPEQFAMCSASASTTPTTSSVSPCGARVARPAPNLSVVR